MIVTIDGPAGSGKSTAARLLARQLGIAYLDSGAMYRAVTVAGLRRGIDLCDTEALARLAGEVRIELAPGPDGLKVLLDGEEVSVAIRENEVSRQTHHAASNERVRAHLVAAQQRIGRQWQNLVSEGRDQGTVVFPEAEVKFYLDARPEVRARRRQKELAGRGSQEPLKNILEELNHRDQSDRSRRVGPLKAAEEAIVVDTTEMTIEQVVDHLLKLVRRRTGG